jgi:hypothetical protein
MELFGPRGFWLPFFAFALLLGVYLAIFGIGVAGYLSAVHERRPGSRKASQTLETD